MPNPTLLPGETLPSLPVTIDGQAHTQAFITPVDVHFPIAYDLSLESMPSLGLYISPSRSEQKTAPPLLLLWMTRTV